MDIAAVVGMFALWALMALMVTGFKKLEAPIEGRP